MTDFEEKISKYLREANYKFKQCKSQKLKRFYYLDMKALLELIVDNDLNIDVESIFKRTDILLDISNLEDKYAEAFLHNYYECEKVNNKVGDLGVYLDNLYGYGYFKKYKKRLSIDESFRLCDDFFAYYDKDISRFFRSMLDKGNIFLGGNLGGKSNLVFDGCSYSFKCQDEPFILANTFNNVYFPNVMVHEIIHSYIDYSSDDNTFEKNCLEASNNMVEVYSRFIELVFSHYLEEIHFNKNDIDALNLSNDNSLIGMLSNYNDFLKFFDGEMLLYDNYLYSDFIMMERYAYGGVLAYHYFNQYLNNPERTKDNITNFSLNYRNYDRKYLLNNYGLKEDDIGKSKVLVKHMKNHYKY